MSIMKIILPSGSIPMLECIVTSLHTNFCISWFDLSTWSVHSSFIGTSRGNYWQKES